MCRVERSAASAVVETVADRQRQQLLAGQSTAVDTPALLTRSIGLIIARRTSDRRRLMDMFYSDGRRRRAPAGPAALCGARRPARRWRRRPAQRAAERMRRTCFRVRCHSAAQPRRRANERNAGRIVASFSPSRPLLNIASLLQFLWKCTLPLLACVIKDSPKMLPVSGA